MNKKLIPQLVFFLASFGTVLTGLSLCGIGCKSSISLPSVPASVPTVTVTLTPSPTPINTPVNTHSFTPTPTLTSTATNSPTNTPGSPSATPTPTPTNTPTNTPTATPTSTGTWFTNTPTISPTSTFTDCFTPSLTPTGTMVTPPVIQNYISGSLAYTGSGSGTNLFISGGAEIYTFPSSGTYTIGVSGPGVYQLSAYYDYRGIWPDLFHCSTCGFFSLVIPVPGMRYTNSGSCSNPVTVASYAVTVSGAAGTTTIGPNLSFDDTCSYWGIYGTLSYTGSKGTVQICRQMYLNAYLDATYSTPAPYSTAYYASSGSYSFVTNLNAGGTGLSPLYLRAWFDANGDYSFDTGDPYVNLGPLAPSTDGLLQNISFGDAFIK